MTTPDKATYLADSNPRKASEGRGSRQVGYQPEPTPQGGQDVETTGAGLPESNPSFVPDIEVVAIRTGGEPHDHIVSVKLADGNEQNAAEVIAAIRAHDAHYVMRLPQHELPLLVRIQQCPDCNETVLWA